MCGLLPCIEGYSGKRCCAIEKILALGVRIQMPVNITGTVVTALKVGEL